MFETVTLSSVCTIVKQTPPQFDGYKQYVATADLQKSEIISSTKVTYENRPSRADSTVRFGDVLFAKMAGTEKTLIAKREHQDMLFSTGFAILRPIPEILDSAYLYHILRSEKFLLQKDRMSSGATQKAITNKALLKIKISIPPISEQKRIAAILDKADEIKDSIHQTQEMRSELITATFLDMFGDPIVNPKNFNRVKLESVTKFHKQGLYFNQGYSNSGNQLIRIADMRKDGSLNFGTMPFIEIESKIQKQFCVEVGDFLFARSGSIGTCAIVRKETNAVFGSFIIKFQFTEELLNDYFLHYYQLPQIEKMMRSMSHGSTNTNINAKNIKNLDVILPPLSLQKKFVRIVHSIKQMPDSTELSSINLAALLQGILP